MVLRGTEMVPVRTLEYATPEMWSRIPGPLLPGQSFTDRYKRSLPFKVSVNNLGFRGAANIPRSKPAGSFRVLCLGDSYTFGAYVDDSETWPAQLEVALREANPDRQVDVINGGVSGFTIVDELAIVKEQGLSVEPDVVVIGFVLNDLADLTRRVSSREMLRISASESAAYPLGPFKTMLRQTAIYNAMFLMKAWVRKSTGNDPTIQEVGIYHLLKPRFDDSTVRLFEQYKRHLVELKTILDARGIPLVLMIFPYWEQISQGATDEAQRRLEEVSRELHVPTVNLLSSFRRHDAVGRKFFHMPWDHHPSARGYRRAARELATVIEPILTAEHPTRAPGAAPARSQD